MSPREFATTKLGRDAAGRWGWTEADFDRLAWFWPDATRAADEAHQNPASRGRAALKVKLKYAEMFGATPDELVRIERYERGGTEVVGSGLMPEKFRDLFYCGQVMAKAPGLAGTPLDDATAG